MSHVIIDRRLTGTGKNSLNRQKFLEKVRNLVKEATRDSVGNIKIADITRGGKKIRIPLRNLDEPSFSHDGEGVHDLIIPGNDRYQVGDKIKRPPQGGAGGGDGEGDPEGENGADDFEFTLTKEEFLDFFFDNCELPDLVRKNIAKISEFENARSGFRNDGSPSTLNVVRSMRYAKSRKLGFGGGKRRKIKELQAERELLVVELTALNHTDKPESSLHHLRIIEVATRIAEIDEEIAKLKRQIDNIPFIDPIDLKYNAWSKNEVPAVQAVMFCILDVSGSMDERKKELAKTFFMLLYLFIERNYQHTEIVFIRHTTTAQEVDEETFFNDKENGGTIVSPALELVSKIINERYPLDSFNVFIAQSTDGDNYGHDNTRVREILTQDLLTKAQFYAYAQINPDGDWRGSPVLNDPYNMWKVFDDISKAHPKLGCGMITSPETVYQIFRKLFEKKAK